MDVSSQIAKLSVTHLRSLRQSLLDLTPETAGRLALTRQPRDGSIPASYAQERLWFLERLGLVGATYNMPVAVRLKGTLSHDALESALRTLVERHESLRTRFADRGGELFQVVDSATCFRLEYFKPLAGSSEEIARWIEADSQKRFDLAEGPLFRASIARISDVEHVLLITMHHIISDGWSMGVLLRELEVLYAAFVQRRDSPLAPLEVQYADYALWQRRYLQANTLQRHLEYWKVQLAGAPPMLDLPTDRPRSAVPSFRGALHPFELSHRTSAKVMELSRREGATVYMLLLASLQIVLRRWSGQRDVLVGSPVAGRTLKQTEGLIGFFLNTIVMRGDLSGNPSFQELLQRTRNTALEAYMHQDLPFARLVAELAPQRDLSHQALFQVMLIVQNMPFQSLRLSGLEVQPMSIGHVNSMFDMTVNVYEANGQLQGWVEYATDLFDAATIARFIAHYTHLIEQIVQQPRARLSELDLLTAEERHRVLWEWNRTESDSATHQCLHHLFSEQAALTPDATALVCEDERLSYAELDRRSNQLSRHLLQLGVQTESIVALCVERSISMVVGLLGILKAGGVYLPLDPAYPSQRLKLMLADAKASVLVTTSAGEKMLRSQATEDAMQWNCVLLDVQWQELATLSSDAVLAPVAPENLAYLIYTSGSTGTPKGVAATHASMVNRIRAQADIDAFLPDDICCQKTSIGFLDSMFETLGTLLHGNPLVIATAEQGRDVQRLIELLQHRNISRLVSVPSLAAAILDALTGSDSLANLRSWTLSGEPLGTDLLRRLQDRLPRCTFFNLYGSSEVAADSTAFVCRGELPVAGKHVPIGRPIANTQVYILDEDGELVPVGSVGEVCIGGAGLARGYLNLAGLTAERFVAHPFVSGARLYRTGDLARHRADGNLELVGRYDQQVKIRGFRIELGEIEALLLKHEIVKEAVVVAQGNDPSDKRLVAYITQRNQSGSGVEELRLYLKANLPEYMVPSALVALERLPLTASGKLDRNALPAPQINAHTSHRYEPPQGAVEEILAGIWQSLLEVDRVGRQHDFFELGGHSLLAVRLVSRIQQHLSVQLPLANVFARPRLCDLAQLLRQCEVSELPPIRSIARDQRLPLSFAQRRLWFLSQLPGVSESYHIPLALHLKGALNVVALKRSLDRLWQRHEALRSRFANEDGEPFVQVISVEQGFALEQQHLQGLEQAEETLAALTAEEARTPFDLSVGPLIRGRLIRLAEQEHVLLITQHHIVSDGWSMGVLFSELSASYAALAKGEPDPLPMLSIQYADYAAWQQQWLSGERLHEQAQYWQERLASAPVLLELPMDRPRPAQQDFRGSRIEFALDEALTAALKSLSQQLGVTLFMTLLAAWSVVLSRLSGQQDVVIGTASANRSRLEIEGLIGLFVNTLALRMDLSAEPSVRQWLEQVKRDVLEAQQHQELPFEQVVELVQPPRRLSHTPIFQVMLAWHNNEGWALDLPGIEVKRFGAALERVKFDLELNLGEAQRRIVGMMSYAAALFDEATISRHVEYFRAVLEGFVRDCDQPVHRIELLSARERQRLLVEWNETARPYPREKRIHELFAERVARTPAAIALVYEGTSLSYAELNAEANRLARHLIEQGVKAGDAVVMLLERSAELVIAQLGILQAGAMYVPLDPQMPQARQDFILSDCGARLLITSSGQTGIVLSRLSEGNSDDALPLPMATTDGQAPAYIMYTSGSTGEPKGVVVPHQAVVRLVINNDYAPLRAHDRVAFVANPAFDAATFEVWGTLLNGAQMLVVPKAVSLDASSFSRMLTEGGVTVLHLTTALFQQHAQELKEVFGKVRMLLFGGEAADAQVVRRVLRDSAPRCMIHLYGPTETTAFASAYRVETVSEEAQRLPIGRAIANTTLYVLDRHGQPVPTGVVGELYIGGEGVARGYLNRPELTQERFLPDPFSASPRARMYRTGDFVRYRADGHLEFIGRNDHQVKIRGFRIELQEIESQLLKYEHVKEAVVLVQEDVPGEKRLVAYFTSSEPDPELNLIQSVRSHLCAALPEYMLPTAYVVLEHLPLTPNGKLDRKSLPTPDESTLVKREYEPPQGEIETVLARLWSELLGVERVGRQDHFFELGGHSLLAVRLVSRVQQQLSVELSPTSLFTHARLCDLARAIERHEAVALPPISRVPRDQGLPLSFAQQRLWFLAQLPGVSESYHIPLALMLNGKLDAAALKRSLDRLWERHEVLRSRFVQEQDEPLVQLVSAEEGFALVEQDLQGVEHVEETLAALTAEEARTPFDLSAGPLIRGRLIRLSEHQHSLLITQHHIVSDGWSRAILFNELSALYAAFSQGEADPLPALSIQYADYASWQRQWLGGERLQKQAQYWQETLAGAPVLLELPADRPRPATQDFSGASIEVALDAHLTEALKRLSQAQGVTLFMTVLAAWSVVLARLSGQNDVVIGIPSANRDRLESEGLIGFFVNTLAVRMELTPELSVRQWLEGVKHRVLQAQRNQDLPFQQVVELVQPPRRLSHTPIFQVILAWQNNEHGELKFPGLEVQGYGVPFESVKFDLELNLAEVNGRIVGSLSYATALFDAATMRRHVGYLQTVLAGFVQQCDQTVQRMELLSAEERHRLLVEWNETSQLYPREKCIHQIFEQQVDKTPNAIALVYEQQSLTYAELNVKANQLAHYLRARGVGPDRRVGICMERSLEMIIGLLGILKAGGAYVPLDPSYPAQRLAYLLKDSVPVVVLSDVAGRKVLARSDVPLIDLTQAELWSTQSEVNLDARALGLTSQHLVYVIYTSGSTGEPKGVMVEHRNVVNHWWALQALYGEPEHCRHIALNAPITFDASVQQWSQLLSGRTLFLVPESLRHDPGGLLGFMAENRIDGIDTTPSHLSTWIAAGLLDQQGHALRTVLVGGEAIDAVSWNRISECPDVVFYNVYGPTECTVDTTASIPERAASSPHIGQPLQNSRVYILDDLGQPVPIGVKGEIHIAGAGVARGYLNRPGLTAQRFTANPFDACCADRMYRTGDLGRWRENGTIDYLGRNDDQVKIRGYRIELGEIETRLQCHESVREAVVVVRNVTDDDRRLVAYVIGRGSDRLSPDALRVWLRHTLPEYMVPHAFVILDRWPLTRSGKLDRRALPSPDIEVHGERYEAPLEGIETVLAGVWQSVLGLERVGRRDNFFELGGHSLTATRVVSRVNQMFDVDLSVRDLFDEPTIEGLSRSLTDAVTEDGSTEGS